MLRLESAFWDGRKRLENLSPLSACPWAGPPSTALSKEARSYKLCEKATSQSLKEPHSWPKRPVKVGSRCLGGPTVLTLHYTVLICMSRVFLDGTYCGLSWGQEGK